MLVLVYFGLKTVTNHCSVVSRSSPGGQGRFRSGSSAGKDEISVDKCWCFHTYFWICCLHADVEVVAFLARLRAWFDNQALVQGRNDDLLHGRVDVLANEVETDAAVFGHLWKGSLGN